MQGVLVDLPVFHDQVEIPVGVSNESEVLKWITIHHEEVGRSRRFVAIATRKCESDRC